MSDIRRRSSYQRLVLLAALLAGLIGCNGRAKSAAEAALACRQELPFGLHPERLLVLDFKPGESLGLMDRIFLEDIEELLLAKGYQPISAQSELAASLPARCVARRLEIELRPKGDVELGQAVLETAEGEAETWHESGASDWVRLALRQRFAARLVGFASPLRLPSSLHDPLSAGFRDRITAMRLQGEGQLGEAAEVLRSAIARGGGDEALRYRLGGVLYSWAKGMRAALSLPNSGLDEVSRQKLEVESTTLLQEAELQIGRSLQGDSRSALACFVRGKIRLAFGQRDLAASDFSSALEIWPAHGEAVHELAQLRIQPDHAWLASRILDAIHLGDPREDHLRSELYYDLGVLRLASGEAAGAVAALQQSIALAPAEKIAFRSEALASLERAQSLLAGKNGGDAASPPNVGSAGGETSGKAPQKK